MNDDTISRQAAIELVHHTIFGFFGIAEDNSESIISDEELRLFEINRAINNGIKALPSAKPQKGEWKPFDLTYGRHIFFCTACNNAAEVPTDYGKPMFKFCPWCGARMKTDDRD